MPPLSSKTAAAFIHLAVLFAAFAISHNAVAVPIQTREPLVLHASNAVFVIHFTRSRTPNGKDGEALISDDPTRHFGAGMDADSSFMIDAIRFERCGFQDKYLPASAYAGLYDVANISIDHKGRSALLRIEGGDASVSFRAEIEVAPYGVVRRSVFNKTTGYEEVTDYRYTFRQLMFFEERISERVSEGSAQRACKSPKDR